MVGNRYMELFLGNIGPFLRNIRALFGVCRGLFLGYVEGSFGGI